MLKEWSVEQVGRYLSEASMESRIISCSPLFVNPTRNSVTWPAGSSKEMENNKIFTPACHCTKERYIGGRYQPVRLIPG